MDTQLLRNRPASTFDRAMAGVRGQRCLPRRAIRFVRCRRFPGQAALGHAPRIRQPLGEIREMSNAALKPVAQIGKIYL
jgi:hypothetical protein